MLARTNARAVRRMILPATRASNGSSAVRIACGSIDA
jgi:hypothetical protein